MVETPRDTCLFVPQVAAEVAPRAEQKESLVDDQEAQLSASAEQEAKHVETSGELPVSDVATAPLDAFSGLSLLLRPTC